MYVISIYFLLRASKRQCFWDSANGFCGAGQWGRQLNGRNRMVWQRVFPPSPAKPDNQWMISCGDFHDISIIFQFYTMHETYSCIESLTLTIYIYGSYCQMGFSRVWKQIVCPARDRLLVERRYILSSRTRCILWRYPCCTCTKFS